MTTQTDAERFAEWLAMDTGMPVHWRFGPEHPSAMDGDSLCIEWVTGDAVVDHDRTLVTCAECLEWMHA